MYNPVFWCTRTRTSDLTPLQTWLQTTHTSWRSLLGKSDKVQYFIHFVHLYVASVFLLKKDLCTWWVFVCLWADFVNMKVKDIQWHTMTKLSTFVVEVILNLCRHFRWQWNKGWVWAQPNDCWEWMKKKNFNKCLKKQRRVGCSKEYTESNDWDLCGS